MKWVRLDSSTVIEVIDFNPAGKYHESIIWHECNNDSVEQQWTTDGANWYPPEIPTPEEPLSNIEALKLIKLNELANLRYEKETSGIEVNSMKIRTDRESQALINGAYISTLINPNFTIDWKCENGWITLTAEQIAGIATLVANHVQSCFTREKEITELIEQNPDIDIDVEW